MPTLFRFILGLHRAEPEGAKLVVHPALELLLRKCMMGGAQAFQPAKTACQRWDVGRNWPGKVFYS